MFILLGLLSAGPVRADAVSGLTYFQDGHFSEAYQAWRAAADQGDPASALYLGVVYDTGFGVAHDDAAALGWYSRAGSEGNVTAMFNTAVMYDAGRGTAANPAVAARWYASAAARGYGRAAYNLAMLYESGSGVPRDPSEAVRLYREAASHGITAARAHLAALHAPAMAAAVRPTVDPAMTSFSEAEHLLLTRGTADAARAVDLFRQSAENGNPLAAYNLAYCYERGLGVAPDRQQALFWYRRSAAEAGNTAIREIAERGYRNLMANISHGQR